MPRGAAVSRGLHLGDVGFPRPRRAVDGHSSREPSAVPWARDYRLHAEASDGVGIFWIHAVAGFQGLARKAIGRTHEVAGIFFVEHLDFGDPLAGCRPDPAGNKSASGKAV